MKNARSKTFVTSVDISSKPSKDVVLPLLRPSNTPKEPVILEYIPHNDSKIDLKLPRGVTDDSMLSYCAQDANWRRRGLYEYALFGRRAGHGKKVGSDSGEKGQDSIDDSGDEEDGEGYGMVDKSQSSFLKDFDVVKKLLDTMDATGLGESKVGSFLPPISGSGARRPSFGSALLMHDPALRQRLPVQEKITEEMERAMHLERRLKLYRENPHAFRNLQMRVKEFVEQKKETKDLTSSPTKMNRRIVGKMTPAMRIARIQAWRERDEQRIKDARKKKFRLEYQNHMNLLHHVERKEELWDKREERHAMQERRRFWFTTVFLRQAHTHLLESLFNIRRVNFQQRRMERASIIIQRSYRSFRSKRMHKKIRRAKIVLKKFFMFAFHNMCDKKRARSANLIRSFFTHIHEAYRILFIVRRFRVSVIRVQRSIRSMQQRQKAQMVVLHALWERVAQDMADSLKRRIKRVPHSDRGRGEDHSLSLRFPPSSSSSSSSSSMPPTSSSLSTTSSTTHRGSVLDLGDEADLNDPLTLAIRRESILRVPFDIRNAILREFQEKTFHIGLKKVRLHKRQMEQWRTEVTMAVARHRMAINREQRSREIFSNIGRKEPKKEEEKEKKVTSKLWDVVVHKKRDDDEKRREIRMDQEVIRTLEKGQLYKGSVCRRGDDDYDDDDYDDDDDDGVACSSERKAFIEIQKKYISSRPITPRQTMFPSKAEVRLMVEEGVRRTTAMLTKKLKDRDPTLTEFLHPTKSVTPQRLPKKTS
eukprot:TRINITY_DN825_c0_g1_i1.p1 TRINITY_DN825_c0_g1~~TRINITY_DN825_c0_g1_i1.p1  ORF type:complete len:760 (+),score=215.11 TRINITY_DN825_c0_g1_i1:137-2416(+)